MTTAPTNEMLADEFACKLNSRLVYEGFTLNAPFTPKLLAVLTRAVREEVTPLFARLSATPSARDVREALEYALGSLRTIAGGWRNSSPGQLGAIAQAGIDLAELGPEKCAEMRGEASNLDAAAPAAGGDAEPVAWRWRCQSEPSWRVTNHRLSMKDAARRDGRFQEQALYAAPPLQAPADSDAVREALEYAVREIKQAQDLLSERIEGNPARSPGHNARLVLEHVVRKLNAALTAPAAKAGDNS